MARFRFAVFKERLELLTPTKGISDNLNTDSASFDFRTPEWEGLSKWAHFTNYDYEGGVEYDFNLVDDEIPVDEGLNLPPGVWDVYVHAEVIDAQAIVRRLVTNVVSIVSDQSDAYDGQYLPPIGPSVAEQIDAKATAAWDAKITSASAEIHNDVGEAYADLEITGENGNKNLHFDFHNIKGDPGSDGEQGQQGDPGTSIYSIVRTSGTGAPGTVDTYTVTLTDGTIGGTFEVYNGADGAGTVQSVSGILPDASGDIPLIIFGNTAPTTSTVGYVKQLYFDTISSLIYMCTDDSDPYVWALASGSVTGVKGGAESTYRTGNVNITAANVGAVPVTRTVNSKALSSDISLDYSDVGAVPVTRTVNSKALSSDISLDYSDVGASPTGHASSSDTYGKGTDTNYGHVKLSDSTSSTSAVSSGTAATPKAVKDAYDLANSKTSAMIVDVSDTQPTDPDNKLWIPEVVTETQVPTWAEHQELSGAISSMDTDDVANESNVTGATTTAALNTLNGAINNKSDLIAVQFSNSTDIRTQVDALPVGGYYFGKIESPSTNYFPATLSGMVIAMTYTANHKHVFYVPNGDSDVIYVLWKNSTWRDWVQIARRSDIDNMKGMITSWDDSDTWVASRTYSKGDYIFQSPYLYVAKQAIPQGTALNSTNLVSARIGEHLQVLEEAEEQSFGGTHFRAIRKSNICFLSCAIGYFTTDEDHDHRLMWSGNPNTNPYITLLLTESMRPSYNVEVADAVAGKRVTIGTDGYLYTNTNLSSATVLRFSTSWIRT